MPRLSLAKLERHLYAAADRLRQEGLDAAIYKDYIFGLLFLKRCSDVFEAERERIVGKRVEQGAIREQVEETYGEDPDFYDGFFVPKRSRWTFLHRKLNDASEPFGSVLDKALGGLSECNDSLAHVLDHISFMRTQGNKRVISDEACKDLVRHFNRQRLRNEDFQFSDLLGAAYEFLINMFAESAGKKGGDFYTPRDVIRLMARLLKPGPKMSIYDPTCGSGGMLIISREYVEQCGGDPTNLRLCGQVNDASAWSICRLNMLLHGVAGADIRLQDTLLHPLHLDGEVLERFDRVIANPPFSQNYTRADMEFPERFRWGWCPTTGKKGDLMFAQHMLHVCKPDGMVATVMPHGVLFRGGAEKEIRRKFLEDDPGVRGVSYRPEHLCEGFAQGAVLLLRSNNIQDGCLVLDNVQHVPADIVGGRQFVMPGDVVVCMSNGSKALVGKSARCPENAPKNLTVGAFCSVFHPAENTEPSFVAHVFRSPTYRRHVDFVLAGSAINNLRNSDIEEFSLQVPPLSEQTRIAQILDTADALIAASWAVVAKLRQVRAGMLHDLLTRGLDAHGQLRDPAANPKLFKNSPLGRIPREWEVEPLGNAIDMKSGNGLTSEQLYESGLFSVFGGNGLRGFTDSFTHEGDFVLIGRQGALCGNICIASGRFYATEHAVVCTPRNPMNAVWLSNVLERMNLNRFSESSAQPGLAVGKISNLPLALPTKPEQDSIASLLATHDRIISAEQAELRKLRQLKSGLMTDLLEGRVRVPEDRSEEVAGQPSRCGLNSKSR